MKTLKQFEGWGIMYNTYTIGELAKILGITAETIRYYERKGIIAPIHDQGNEDIAIIQLGIFIC